MRCASKSSLAVGAAALVLAAALPSHAVTIHVPDDQPTIQAGIDAASVGDTVLVACGTYYEHDIMMKSGVCLTSETGEAACATIDAGELGRVMYCADVDETASIEGFLLSNGFMHGSGGGVFCSSSSPAFRSCTFADNFCEGDMWSPARGGGMHCQDSSPVLVGCEFSNNHASNGALSCIAGSSPTLAGCTFSGNEGSGMSCYDSSPTLASCTFSGNEGSGMSCYDSSPTLANCTFSGNESSGMSCYDSSPTLANCIIAFNTGGEAIDCWDASNPSLTCCDVFGNASGDWVGCISEQNGINGNVQLDPYFCDWAQGDLTIGENSPCAAENNPECGLIGAFDVGCGVVVPPACHIDVSDTLLEFGQACIGYPSPDTLLVSNTGAGWLIVFEISADHPDFSADLTSMAVPPGDTQSVQVEFAPSSTGPITGALTILSNDSEHPAVEISLEGEGWGSVHIAVSDTLLAFGSICVGSTPIDPTLFVVTNQGLCPLIVSDIDADNSDFSVSITSFTVPPGGTRLVYVEFAPSTVGPITATLTITSSDPDHPTLEIMLVGEGLAEGGHVAASDTLMSFGSVLIGAAGWDHFFVANVGCDLLTVSDIIVDHGDFFVNTTGFSLEPEGYWEVQEVAVGFAPSMPGLITATMTILSDDPDDPEFEILLEGEGLVSPEIAVSPDSLCGDLLVGETETQYITIENAGGSELVWSARAVNRAGARAPARIGPDRSIYGSTGTRGPSEEAAAVFGRNPGLEDLAGIEILWDQSHGQSTDTHTTMLTLLTSRGATVTENYARIDHALLNVYDIVWINDCSDSFRYAEVQALAVWVALGGSLLLEGENDSTVEVYNDILTTLGAGIEYSVINGIAGVTTDIYPHPTTTGVDSVHLWYPKAHLSAATSPALPLIDDIAGVPNSACSEVGFGRVVTMAADLANNFHLIHGNTEVFVNQVFDWMAMGTTCTWLSCEPSSGTVEVGGSVEVGVTFDATELLGGDYLAYVQVRSNDVDDRRTWVAACLHVTGEPDIAVSSTHLALGEVEVGAVVAETLLVWNEGTDLLTVSDASSDHGDFSVYPVNFALLPEESRAVVVWFAPSTEGLITGTLTVLSDDPDEGTVVVALEGTGIGATPVESSLYATATELGTVMLRWTVPSLTGIDGFNVYRATSRDGPFARANEHVIVPSTPGSFEDTDVWPETTFWYELRAVLSDDTEDMVAGSPASVTTGGRLVATLYPARPNPFTGETTMQLDVPNHAGHVRLAIYNARGQLVRRLIDGTVDRGRREIVWNGLDERGRHTSAGIYFVRLEVGGVTRTQKVAVVR